MANGGDFLARRCVCVAWRHAFYGLMKQGRPTDKWCMRISLGQRQKCIRRTPRGGMSRKQACTPDWKQNRYLFESDGFAGQRVWSANCIQQRLLSRDRNGKRSWGNALVCLVANGGCFRGGDLHGSSQPANSKLACASVFCLRGRSFKLASWMAWRRTESGRSGAWVFALRIAFLDGRDGRGRRKALRRSWSVDWPVPVIYRISADRPGGRSDGTHLGSLWRISEGIVPAHRRPLVQKERTRGSGSQQPDAAEDAVRTGHRDWDIDFVFCTVINGERQCPA